MSDIQLCECTTCGCECTNYVAIASPYHESIPGYQCDDCKNGIHQIPT